MKDETCSSLAPSLKELITRAVRYPWGGLIVYVKSLSDADLLRLCADDFVPILRVIEGKKGLPGNMAATAITIAEARDPELLREFLSKIFEDAIPRWPDAEDPKEIKAGIENRAQLTARHTLIMWLWVAVIIGTGLYVPWTGPGGSDRGYGLIFQPPYYGIHVDNSRLAIEWILATLVAGALFFTWPEKKKS